MKLCMPEMRCGSADILVGGSQASLLALLIDVTTGRDAGEPQAKMPALQI